MYPFPHCVKELKPEEYVGKTDFFVIIDILFNIYPVVELLYYTLREAGGYLIEPKLMNKHTSCPIHEIQKKAFYSLFKL